MVKPRISETDHGIIGDFTTRSYDEMMRNMRNRGWLEINEILNHGISSGLALEIGPGPGYLGLEWLKRTGGTELKGLDISEDMLAIARKNAADYGFSGRTEYLHGDAAKMPFENACFDAVFTNGSLHEWASPADIFNEIARLLKPGGRYVITDLRRDMAPPLKWLLWLTVKPRRMRAGLITSINAAYTPTEIRELLQRTSLPGWNVSANPLGIVIFGQRT